MRQAGLYFGDVATLYGFSFMRFPKWAVALVRAKCHSHRQLAVSRYPLYTSTTRCRFIRMVGNVST